MKPTIDLPDSRGVGLTPFQAQVVNDVVQGPLPLRKLLIGPPGSGKTYSAFFAAQRIAEGSVAYRILILGPRSHAAMYTNEIAHFITGAFATVVDRRKFREFEAISSDRDKIWPDAIVAVMGMDTARQPDILQSLCTVSWDLVIVEEVHLYGRARWTLLKTLLAKETFRRVLMTTAIPGDKKLASLLKNVPRTEWKSGELVDREGRLIYPEEAVKYKLIVYQNSNEEILLQRNVFQLAKGLARGRLGDVVKSSLYRQALSSPLALDRAIRNLRNRLVHSLPEQLSLWDGDRGNDSLAEDMLISPLDGTILTKANTLWKSKLEAIAQLITLIEQTDSLSTDTKRKALEDFLTVQRIDGLGGQVSVAIICSFQITVHYLYTALSELGFAASAMTGAMTIEERSNALERFRAEKGLLICTTAVLKGVDLRDLRTVVHYDLPASRNELFVRIARSTNAMHYLMKSNAGILPDNLADLGLDIFIPPESIRT